MSTRYIGVAVVARPYRYQGRRQRTPGYQGHHRPWRLCLDARRRHSRSVRRRAAVQGAVLGLVLVAGLAVHQGALLGHIR